MKKIVKTDKLIEKYLIKVILSNVFTILFFTLIFAIFIYKFDMQSDYIKFISIFVGCLSSIIISSISTSGFKNSIAIFGIISVLPLIIFQTVNACVNGNFILLLIKVVAELILAVLSTLYFNSRGKKFKV